MKQVKGEKPCGVGAITLDEQSKDVPPGENTTIPRGLFHIYPPGTPHYPLPWTPLGGEPGGFLLYGPNSCLQIFFPNFFILKSDPPKKGKKSISEFPPLK